MPRPAVAAADADPLSEEVARLDLGGEASGGDEGIGAPAPTTSLAAPSGGDPAGKLPAPGGERSAPRDAASSRPRAGSGTASPSMRSDAAEAAAASAAAAAKTADSVSSSSAAAAPIRNSGSSGGGEEGGGGDARANASPLDGTLPPPPPPPPPPQQLDGQPQACSFFLKTATCAFGSKCRFAHPVDLAPPVRFNVLGLPLRPAEPACA